MRKPHNHLLGYVAERKCYAPCGGHIVIYDTETPDFDIQSPARWMVVHEPSTRYLTESSLRKAYRLMRDLSAQDYCQDAWSCMLQDETFEDLLPISRKASLQCPACESVDIDTSMEDQSLIYGEGKDAVELPVRIPIHRCRKCALEFTDSLAEEIRHEAICRHQDVMTPREVESIRRAYGLSRSDFAQITRIGEASLGRWETGNLIQNKAYDSFMYLLRFAENLDRLRQRAFDQGDK